MNRPIKLIIIILICLFAFWKMVTFLAPGSYPFAEIYEIHAPEKEVIDAIEEFKIQNPHFVVPPVTMDGQTNVDLKSSEGRDSNSYWYFNYFYYQDKNQILFTWTRPIDQKSTEFAFVGVNDGLELGNWKDVNDDFWFFENRRVKKEFKERIIDQVKDIIKTKK